MTTKPMKPDMIRERQTLIMVRMFTLAAVAAGLILLYQGTKPAEDDPYKECWTFIIGWDGQCKGDLAASALTGNGYTHSKEYLNNYE